MISWSSLLSIADLEYAGFDTIFVTRDVDKLLELMSLGLGKIDNENRREAAAPLSIHSQSVAHSMRYGIFSEHVDPWWQSSRW